MAAQIARPGNAAHNNFSGSYTSINDTNGNSSFLAPNTRVNALQRKSSDIESPSDSLLDLYGQGRSANASMNHVDMEQSSEDEDPERSRWIHRDKLAKIESKELREAGILLPRPRAYSRPSRSSANSRSQSREQSASGLGRKESRNRTRNESRSRRESLSFRESPDDEADNYNSYTQDNGATTPEAWDLRTPEEIAAEASYPTTPYGSLSKGASKIPLSLHTPVPIPLDYIERNQPVKRVKSTNWGEENGNGIAYPRRESISKSVRDESPPVSMAQRPPAKRQTSTEPPSPAKKAGSTPQTRKTSTSKPTPPVSNRPKTRSGSNTNSRPGTRSGEVKRPEGDPPWLAGMYKPDPRLPPDQQLLPTVARRLQQEQWEKEGRFGNTYDTQFRPLNDQEPKAPSPDALEMKDEEPKEASQEEGERRGADWPLRSRSPEKEPRPPTSGGYSTVPKIHETMPVTPRLPPQELQRQQQQLQVEQENKKKAGCGCCLMM